MLYLLKQLICNDQHTADRELTCGKQIPLGKELLEKHLNTSAQAAAIKQFQYFPGFNYRRKPRFIFLNCCQTRFAANQQGRIADYFYRITVWYRK